VLMVMVGSNAAIQAAGKVKLPPPWRRLPPSWRDSQAECRPRGGRVMYAIVAICTGHRALAIVAEQASAIVAFTTSCDVSCGA
jgi:hypothetical protein